MRTYTPREQQSVILRRLDAESKVLARARPSACASGYALFRAVTGLGKRVSKSRTTT